MLDIAKSLVFCALRKRKISKVVITITTNKMKAAEATDAIVIVPVTLAAGPSVGTARRKV